MLVGAAVVAAKAHGPPAGPPYPALHVHALGDVLRAGECEFAGQSTHTSSTTAGAPGSSSSRRPVLTHGPPASPLYPALEVHAFCDVLPNGESELAGQGVHACGVNPAQFGFDARWAQQIPQTT